MHGSEVGGAAAGRLPMILIVGYGNPLRGDDALGEVAATDLDGLFRHDERVEVRAVHQLTPDLAETLAGFGTVILVDARRGAPAGEIVVEEVRAAEGSASPFSHYVTPAELLALASVLYGASPRLFLVGITGASFDVGQPLSSPVRAALRHRPAAACKSSPPDGQ